MRLLVAFFMSSFLIACGNAKEQATIKNDPEVMTVNAKLIRKKAFNKAGIEMPYAGDFYLVYNGKEMFVKLSASNVTSEELEPLIGTTRKFSIIEGNGLWDTDDPNVQSRIGEYARIQSVE